MLFYFIVYVTMFIIFYIFPSAFQSFWSNEAGGHGGGGATNPGDGIIGIGNGISNQLPGNNGELSMAKGKCGEFVDSNRSALFFPVGTIGGKTMVLGQGHE